MKAIIYVFKPDGFNITKVTKIISRESSNIIKMEPDDKQFKTRYFEYIHNAEVYAHIVGRSTFDEYRKMPEYEDLEVEVVEGETEESKFKKGDIDWQNLD